jgi:hypothetical protein
MSNGKTDYITQTILQDTLGLGMHYSHLPIL